MSALHFDLRRGYWAATAALVTAGVAGWPIGVPAAIGLTAVQLGHFAWRDHAPGSLTMQVRWLYLAVLLAGIWRPLAALHALAVAGVWANVLFGYCLAARTLVLMPWNRSTPVSIGLIVRTLLAPPGNGGIAERLAAPSESLAADALPRSANGSAAPGTAPHRGSRVAARVR